MRVAKRVLLTRVHPGVPTDPHLASLGLLPQKEVERRRRQAINDGIEALAAIVPGCSPSGTTEPGAAQVSVASGRNMVNKGTVLARSVAYIKALKNNEASNIEKWTLEKLLMDQALGDSSAHADALTAELNRVHAIAERLGIAHLFDPRTDAGTITLPEHLSHLRSTGTTGSTSTTTTRPTPPESAAAPASASAPAPAPAPTPTPTQAGSTSGVGAAPPTSTATGTSPPVPAPTSDAPTEPAAASSGTDEPSDPRLAKRTSDGPPLEDTPEAKRAKLAQ